ncbi:MAG TPA: nuclear transport factor 2 family protein [Acidimicrobiales bacterium]|nr:nuclear transport factor 2 family protein [Acidimicrobiales bacterium]
MYPTTPEERQVYEQLVRYFRAIDEGDFADAAHLMARATVRTSEGTWQGPSGGAELLTRLRLYDGRPATKHLMSTWDIHFEAAGIVAKSLVYVLVLQATEELPLSLIRATRYADTFVKDENTWYLSERDTTVGELTGDLRHHVSPV